MSALRNNRRGRKWLVSNKSLSHLSNDILGTNQLKPAKKSEVKGKSEDEILVCIRCSGHKVDEGCNLGVGGVPFEDKGHDFSVDGLYNIA